MSLISSKYYNRNIKNIHRFMRSNRRMKF